MDIIHIYIYIYIYKYGPPHPQVWKKILEIVVTKCAALADPPASLDGVREYLTNYLKKPAAHIFFIKQARVKEVKEDKCLICWSVSPLLDSPSAVDKALLMSFEAIGADIRPGTAPPDPMERQLQRDIDNLSRRLGKGKGKGKGDKGDKDF